MSQKTPKKIAFLVYTDGACKDNNSSDAATVRRAGSAIASFCCTKEVEDALRLIHREYVEKGPVGLSQWRTKLLEQCEPFVETICRAIPPPSTVGKVTNNRAELYAFNSALAHFLALSATLENTTIDLEIHADSNYVLTAFQNGATWHKNNWRQSSGTLACNIDYVNEMLLYTQALREKGHTVAAKHVAAHCKEKDVPNDFDQWRHWFGNDMADRLSNIAAGAESDINYVVKKKQPKKRRREQR